ncbi:hypothetical protein EGW08_004639 [Elysia chlorotica]|uniref:Cytochrome b561 domain-containing protein n=1 Tax=Elysia chlorotica TaxID=188477 RepID=A0A3S1HWL3_ELYCH|nr:hypothetical protein EGW08_004639 [Elysia chlorotica]
MAEAVCIFKVNRMFSSVAASGCILLGTIFILVSVRSMSWSQSKTSQSSKGLWQFSSNDRNFYYEDYAKLPDGHHAAQIITSMSIGLGCLAIFIFPFHIIVSVMGRPVSRRVHHYLGLLVFTITTIGWGSSVASIIIWGFFVHDSEMYIFGTGFVMCLVGGFFMFLGGMEAYNATRDYPQAAPPRHYPPPAIAKPRLARIEL